MQISTESKAESLVCYTRSSPFENQILNTYVLITPSLEQKFHLHFSDHAEYKKHSTFDQYRRKLSRSPRGRSMRPNSSPAKSGSLRETDLHQSNMSRAALLSKNEPTVKFREVTLSTTDKRKDENDNREYQLWQPFFLSSTLLFGFMATYAALIIALAALYSRTIAQQGLGPANSNLYYVWTYGPTTG